MLSKSAFVSWVGFVSGVLVMALMGFTAPEEPITSTVERGLDPAPATAIAAPADYDGDGFTDFALKGSNGIWYLDVARCSIPASPEVQCEGAVDDDGDGMINDGCPQHGEAAETSCNDNEDDDADGYLDDGCLSSTPAVGRPEPHTACFVAPTAFNNWGDEDHDRVPDDGCTYDPQCFGPDGYGGRWDFAYTGYGGVTSKPVPADYGSNSGPADGKADISVRDTADGTWRIDYADNGFGGWDWIGYKYGTDPSSVALAADYDGDGRADLSMWTTNSGTTNGHWYFDYSSDGYNGWNRPLTGCPYVASRLEFGYPIVGYGLLGDTPAVGRIDSDVCADISIKTSNDDPPAGRWFFDLAATGFGFFEAPCDPVTPGTCTVPLTGYGDASWVPVIANDDPQYPDGNRADLGVKTPDGTWYIDYAADGLGVINSWQSNYIGTPIPGNYDLTLNPAVPRQLDLSIVDSSGNWRVDRFALGGYAGWNEIPGTGVAALHNPSRLPIDKYRPYIWKVELSYPRSIYSDPDLGTKNFFESVISPTSLKIGVRYTASVFVTPGAAVFDGAVAPNPDLHIPSHLHLTPHNGRGMNAQAFTIPGSMGPVTLIRRFTFTCSVWGEFPLGFRFEDHTHNRWNPDYGFKVTCTSVNPGLYGTVTVKTIGYAESGAKCQNIADDDLDGLANDGCPLAGARIRVPGYTSATSNSLGKWFIPSAVGGPHTITISKLGYSDTVALNVMVPSYPVGVAGVQIDTPMEESYSMVLNPVPTTPANSYTTYIDYSRGRTIFHVARLAMPSIALRMGRGQADPAHPDDYMKGRALAQLHNVPLMVNGMWLNQYTGPGVEDDYLDGYFYSQDVSWTNLRQEPLEPGFAPEVCYGTRTPPATSCNGTLAEADRIPAFGIRGVGALRRASIFLTDRDFRKSTDGFRSFGGNIIYDKNLDGVSDYSYMGQLATPLLLREREVGEVAPTPLLLIARGLTDGGAAPWDYVHARTGVGVNANGTVVWLVVADGEGVDGAGGASASHLAEFFRYLGATRAMNVDGGESSEMILKGQLTWRRVNILQSENAAVDSIGCKGCGDFTPTGRLGMYISAGR